MFVVIVDVSVVVVVVGDVLGDVLGDESTRSSFGQLASGPPVEARARRITRNGAAIRLVLAIGRGTKAA